MHKGIVIEVTEQSILVMTPDGQFKQLAKLGRSCEVGSEITYEDTRKKLLFRLRYPRPFALIAASICCLMIIATLSLFGEGATSNKVAAYVTMDINPSIEIGIDKNEQVIEARGINTDGVELLKSITIEGLSLDAFSDLIVERMEQGHYLDRGAANIIITSTIMDKRFEVELAEKVKVKVEEAITKMHTDVTTQEQIVVTAISAPKEVRNEAIAQGVSTGKKAVQLLTRDTGKSTSNEDLKVKPIQDMINENGGISKILPEEAKVTKDDYRLMLKEQLEKQKEELKDRVKEANEDKKDEDKKDEDKKAKEDKKDNEDKNVKEDKVNLEKLEQNKNRHNIKEEERKREQEMKRQELQSRLQDAIEKREKDKQDRKHEKEEKEKKEEENRKKKDVRDKDEEERNRPSKQQIEEDLKKQLENDAKRKQQDKKEQREQEKRENDKEQKEQTKKDNKKENEKERELKDRNVRNDQSDPDIRNNRDGLDEQGSHDSRVQRILDIFRSR